MHDPLSPVSLLDEILACVALGLEEGKASQPIGSIKLYGKGDKAVWYIKTGDSNDTWKHYASPKTKKGLEATAHSEKWNEAAAKATEIEKIIGKSVHDTDDGQGYFDAIPDEKKGDITKAIGTGWETYVPLILKGKAAVDAKLGKTTKDAEAEKTGEADAKVAAEDPGKVPAAAASAPEGPPTAPDAPKGEEPPAASAEEPPVEPAVAAEPPAEEPPAAEPAPSAEVPAEPAVEPPPTDDATPPVQPEEPPVAPPEEPPADASPDAPSADAEPVQDPGDVPEWLPTDADIDALAHDYAPATDPDDDLPPEWGGPQPKAKAADLEPPGANDAADEPDAPVQPEEPPVAPAVAADPEPVAAAPEPSPEPVAAAPEPVADEPPPEAAAPEAPVEPEAPAVEPVADPAPEPTPEPSAVPSAPEPAAKGVGIPQTVPAPEALKYAGDASELGGQGDKSFYTDPQGAKYLFKPAVDAGGGQKPFAAVAAGLVSKLSKQLKGYGVPVEPITLKGQFGTVQPMVELGDPPSLANVKPAALTPDEMKEVAGEHVLDWMTSQHDTHGANLLRLKGGGLAGIDKEQAFRFLGQPGEKLSTTYAPNQLGDQVPYYNHFWGDWAKGKFEFDPMAMKPAIDKAMAVPDAEYTKSLQAYFASLPKSLQKQRPNFVADALARKNGLKTDFEGFITGLYRQRSGDPKGVFSFDTGWAGKGAKPAAPVAPVAPPVVPPEAAPPLEVPSTAEPPQAWGGPPEAEPPPVAAPPVAAPPPVAPVSAPPPPPTGGSKITVASITDPEFGQIATMSPEGLQNGIKTLYPEKIDELAAKYGPDWKEQLTAAHEAHHYQALAGLVAGKTSDQMLALAKTPQFQLKYGKEPADLINAVRLSMSKTPFLKIPGAGKLAAKSQLDGLAKTFKNNTPEDFTAKVAKYIGTDQEDALEASFGPNWRSLSNAMLGVWGAAPLPYKTAPAAADPTAPTVPTAPEAQPEPPKVTFMHGGKPTDAEEFVATNYLHASKNPTEALTDLAWIETKIKDPNSPAGKLGAALLAGLGPNWKEKVAAKWAISKGMTVPPEMAAKATAGEAPVEEPDEPIEPVMMTLPGGVTKDAVKTALDGHLPDYDGDFDTSPELLSTLQSLPTSLPKTTAALKAAWGEGWQLKLAKAWSKKTGLPVPPDVTAEFGGAPAGGDATGDELLNMIQGKNPDGSPMDPSKIPGTGNMGGPDPVVSLPPLQAVPFKGETGVKGDAVAAITAAYLDGEKSTEKAMSMLAMAGATIGGKSSSAKAAEALQKALGPDWKEKVAAQWAKSQGLPIPPEVLAKAGGSAAPTAPPVSATAPTAPNSPASALQSLLPTAKDNDPGLAVMVGATIATGAPVPPEALKKLGMDAMQVKSLSALVNAYAGTGLQFADAAMDPDTAAATTKEYGPNWPHIANGILVSQGKVTLDTDKLAKMMATGAPTAPTAPTAMPQGASPDLPPEAASGLPPEVSGHPGVKALFTTDKPEAVIAGLNALTLNAGAKPEVLKAWFKTKKGLDAVEANLVTDPNITAAFGAGGPKTDLATIGDMLKGGSNPLDAKMAPKYGADWKDKLLGAWGKVQGSAPPPVAASAIPPEVASNGVISDALAKGDFHKAYAVMKNSTGPHKFDKGKALTVVQAMLQKKGLKSDQVAMLTDPALVGEWGLPTPDLIDVWKAEIANPTTTETKAVNDAMAAKYGAGWGAPFLAAYQQATGEASTAAPVGPPSPELATQLTHFITNPYMFSMTQSPDKWAEALNQVDKDHTDDNLDNDDIAAFKAHYGAGWKAAALQALGQKFNTPIPPAVLASVGGNVPEPPPTAPKAPPGPSIDQMKPLIHSALPVLKHAGYDNADEMPDEAKALLPKLGPNGYGILHAADMLNYYAGSHGNPVQALKNNPTVWAQIQSELGDNADDKLHAIAHAVHGQSGIKIPTSVPKPAVDPFGDGTAAPVVGAPVANAPVTVPKPSEYGDGLNLVFHGKPMAHFTPEQVKAELDYMDGSSYYTDKFEAELGPDWKNKVLAMHAASQDQFAPYSDATYKHFLGHSGKVTSSLNKFATMKAGSGWNAIKSPAPEHAADLLIAAKLADGKPTGTHIALPGQTMTAAQIAKTVKKATYDPNFAMKVETDPSFAQWAQTQFGPSPSWVHVANVALAKAGKPLIQSVHSSVKVPHLASDAVGSIHAFPGETPKPPKVAVAPPLGSTGAVATPPPPPVATGPVKFPKKKATASTAYTPSGPTTVTPSAPVVSAGVPPATAPQPKDPPPAGYVPSPEIEKPAPLVGSITSLPKTATPHLAMLQPVPAESLHPAMAAAASKVVGANKTVFQDTAGASWAFAQPVADDGSTQGPHAAIAADLFGRIAQYVKPGASYAAASSHGGAMGVLHPLHGGVGEPSDLSTIPPSVLSESEAEDVAGEHMLDWLTGSGRTHGSRLARTADGRIVGTGQGDAFRYLGADDLSVDYHPGHAEGEPPPYYNQFWKDWTAGKHDFDPMKLKAHLESIESIDPDAYGASVKEYADARHPGQPEAAAAMVMQARNRKLTMRGDFERFLTGLYKQRTGSPDGRFTFDGGWDGGTAAPVVAKAKAKKTGPVMKTYSAEEHATHLGIKLKPHVDPTKASTVQTLSIPKGVSPDGAKKTLEQFVKDCGLTSVEPTVSGSVNVLAFVDKAGLGAAKITKEEPVAPPPTVSGGGAIDPTIKPTPAKPKYFAKAVPHKPAHSPIAGVADLKGAQVGYTGKHFAFDGPLVEGHTMKARRVVAADGSEQYNFEFKVRAPVLAELKSKGTPAMFQWARGSYNKDKDAFVQSNDSDGDSSSARQWASSTGNVHLLTGADGKFGYKGMMHVQVKPQPGQTPHEALLQALEGVKPGFSKDLMRDPTPEEQQVSGLSRLLWARDPQASDQLDAQELSTPGVRTVAKLHQLLASSGVTQEEVAGIQEVEAYPGHSTHVLPGRYRTVGARFLYQGISDLDGAINIVKSSFLGINERHGSHMKPFGSSGGWPQDVARGSSDVTLFRVSTESMKGNGLTESNFSGAYRAIVAPDEIDRLDTHAYPGDTYGCLNPSDSSYGSKYKNRKPVDETIKKLSSGSTDNEIGFRKGVSSKKILRIATSSEPMRQQFIKAARAEGLHEINGIPVEEFCVVANNHDDIYQKYVKPHGY